MKDRRLPDSAIDLMDRTMAAIRIMQENSARELEALTEQLNALTDTSHALSEDEYRQELYWFHTQLHQRISPILFNQLENQTVVAETGPVTQLKKQLDTLLADLLALTGAKKSRVEKQDIAAMVSYKTGIPLGKLQSRERDKLLNMESMLRQRVIGQDHAVKILAEAILESRSGLIKAGQPIGSFFLLGPTGTGKTELAKALADYLFNDEAFLIRFDMSEFKEEHSAALLYGAPPGYVGYQEGGLLVNKIREKPYSVVLFDEIEKAHPSVYDIFLQILDEGRLHDRLGKEGDFSNAVILFTSNIGSEFVTRHFTQGVIPSGNELMEIMGRHFRPEFLARLTEIVPFAPIWEENVVKIFDIQLKGLTDLLHKQGITLEISEEARKHLALAGFSSAFGARPLKAVIRNQLRRPISKMIISGELTKGMEVSITLNTQGAISWQSQVPVEA
jgi:ATP-dependent Clp protease ATP-binding subunit ClpA